MINQYNIGASIVRLVYHFWYISYPSLTPQTFKSEVHLDDPNAILFPKAGQPTPPNVLNPAEMRF